MSSTYTLWCLIDGDEIPFKVIIPIDSDIDDLKKNIKQTCSPMLEKFAAKGLILWKVCYF
jgi:Crinkler effector protein N-terminal domain